MIYNLRFKGNLIIFGTPAPEFFVQHVSHFLSYNIKSFIFSNFKERRKWKAYATLKHLFGISACCSWAYLKIKKIDCLVSSILDFRYSSYFVQLNSLFLITFLFEKSLCFCGAETPFPSMKNHQVSEGRRRLFHQEIFDPFSAGEITLKFSKFENS